ncbi:polysaccharide pyruvyl transferase family protein [Methylopila sp. M107]|uniref:polysaccharide pyruvyl transferase family protein n=1 Tax=Methylopila sp. M107 TaxID=1101190 RepID=UPI00036DB23F|nr:polysaccharide pyruvyl transferase family protein [Methylopila sp. M107]
MSDLKLAWWRPKNPDKINLGDEIGQALCAYVSGRNVVRASILDCDLVAVGSILHWPYSQKSLTNRDRPCHVWGSGLIAPTPFEANDKVVISSVRGHLTRCIVDTPDEVTVGDAALLAADLWPAAPAKRYALGIVPHWSQVNSALARAIKREVPNSVIIDFTKADIKSTLATLSACETIVSSSLHGLIIADSYGIPNAWMKTQELHRGKSWKFYDYFSSVGRESYNKIDIISRIDDVKNSSDDIFIYRHHKNIGAVKADIVKAFPVELKRSFV